MKDERERENSKNKNGQEKRKYKLNKRKFTMAITFLCFAAVAVIIAVHYLSENETAMLISAAKPPVQTVDSQLPSVSVDPEKPLGDTLIVVDAGHGGLDPGASGVSGEEEDDLNLSVAQLLKAELQSKGAEVIMTRSDENAIAETKEEDMAERGEIITESGADFVISVHMNSFEDSSVSGPVVLFLPGSEQGKALAEAVQQRMNERLEPATDGNARSQDLRILKSGYQPSILVECGYISNPDEESKLTSEDYQREVAGAICEGLIQYLNN